MNKRRTGTRPSFSSMVNSMIWGRMIFRQDMSRARPARRASSRRAPEKGSTCPNVGSPVQEAQCEASTKSEALVFTPCPNTTWLLSACWSAVSTLRNLKPAHRSPIRQLAHGLSLHLHMLGRLALHIPNNLLGRDGPPAASPATLRAWLPLTASWATVEKLNSHSLASRPEQVHLQ